MMSLSVCSVVLQVGERRLLISPGSQLQENDYHMMGQITDIIAPNLLHCGGVTKASAFFPKAILWGAPQSQKRKPDIAWSFEISNETWPFSSELPFCFIEGLPGLNEVVFYEVQSKTLIVTDLFFNLKEVRGLGAFVLLHIFGTYQKFAVSRLLLKYVKNRELFKSSLLKVLAWDFQRIVMSHGHSLESGDFPGGARKAVQKALIDKKVFDRFD
jgi:hypothetical protein